VDTNQHERSVAVSSSDTRPIWTKPWQSKLSYLTRASRAKLMSTGSSRSTSKTRPVAVRSSGPRAGYPL